eukprot:3517968-Rhodomonas_salina.5
MRCFVPLRDVCFAWCGCGKTWKSDSVCGLVFVQTMTLDIDGMLADLEAAPDGSVFVLHTVAHNPSGVDPTPDQWKKIADVVEKKKAIPIFDTAYQVPTHDVSKCERRERRLRLCNGGCVIESGLSVLCRLRGQGPS